MPPIAIIAPSDNLPFRIETNGKKMDVWTAKKLLKSGCNSARQKERNRNERTMDS